MAVTVYPSKTVIENCRLPLESATQLIYELLLEHLEHAPEHWDMYVRPLLLGYHPDLLLACPEFGITVINIRDWEPREWRAKGEKLKKYDAARDKWRTIRDLGSDLFLLTHEQRSQLSRTYVTPPGEPERFGLVRGVVALPRFREADAKYLLRKTTSLTEERAGYIGVMGETVWRDARRLALGGKRRARCEGMDETWLSRLRGRLAEPESRSLRREPLELSGQGQEIARNQRGTRTRRVHGPTGSGKSIALAARAANLAVDGCSVLVLSFNITLAHYLRDLISRHAGENFVALNKVDVSHFHGFCKRVVSQSYSGPKQLVALAMANYRSSGRWLPHYDAILVDEGQDFELAWWNFLRRDVLDQEGRREVLMAIDTSQTIYGDKGWTTEPMPGAGFSGPPMRLEGSYRLPPDLVPVMHDFSERFLSKAGLDLPTVPPDRRGVAIAGSERLWRDVDPTQLHTTAVGFVRRLLLMRNFNPSNLVVIASHHTGLPLVTDISEQLAVEVEHIFTQSDDEERRERKLRFFPGTNAMKGTTIHSYKGWESSALLLCIDEDIDHEDGRSDTAVLVYIALTRLLARPTGPRARILVLNAHPRLRGFRDAFEREVAPSEAEALRGQLALDDDVWAGSIFDQLSEEAPLF